MREKTRILISMFIVGVLTLSACGPKEVDDREPLIFASYAERGDQLANVVLLVESVRDFAGRFADAPFRVYVDEPLVESEGGSLEKLASLGAEVRTYTAPGAVTWMSFVRKVHAAAAAESDADSVAALLAWLDHDTIVLDEPAEFILPEGKSLGFRPVITKNIGSPYAEPPLPFWRRAYKLSSVPDSAFFPIVTVATGDTIRPYFNAGSMVVRPERGILRKWLDTHNLLHQDSKLAPLLQGDLKRRIFAHQMFLACAILAEVDRDEMIELSDRINYPLFFQHVVDIGREFNDLEGVVTLRYASVFDKVPAEWPQMLRGPADRIEWMKQRL